MVTKKNIKQSKAEAKEVKRLADTIDMSKRPSEKMKSHPAKPEKVESSIKNLGLTDEEQAFIDRSRKVNDKTNENIVKYPVIFNEWETSGHQLFRIVADTYKGRVLHSIRKYWQDRDTTWKPGKGATVDYEDIDDIISGLQKMKKWMEEHPREE